MLNKGLKPILEIVQERRNATVTHRRQGKLNKNRVLLIKTDH